MSSCCPPSRQKTAKLCKCLFLRLSRCRYAGEISVEDNPVTVMGAVELKGAHAITFDDLADFSFIALSVQRQHEAML